MSLYREAGSTAGLNRGALAEALPLLVWVTSSDGRIVYSNQRWREYTGIDLGARTAEEFFSPELVHPEDAPRIHERWRGITDASSHFEMEYRLRRKDGVYRWHAGRASAVRDESGTLRWYGVAFDIDDRKRAAQYLNFLAEISELLTPSGDVETILRQVAEHVVRDVADWCTVCLTDEAGDIVQSAVAHADPMRIAAVDELVARYPPLRANPAATGEPVFWPTITEEQLSRIARDQKHFELLSTLEMRSTISVPLRSRGKSFGFLQVVNDRDRRTFGADDLDFVAILAKRVALAVDNARVYEREHHISNTFQHALLPNTLPAIQGVELHAVYGAAAREAEVGGDWYDAFVLDDGRLVLSIGDVAGKGLHAAVLMGNVRQAIRAIALQNGRPEAILAAADKTLQHEYPDRIVTAFVGILDLTSWAFEYASAGHPFPMLRKPDGSVATLPGRASAPLGVARSQSWEVGFAAIPADSLLILYTDGLVETTRNLFAGERRLFEVLSQRRLIRSSDPAKAIHEELLREGASDDVAILTARVGRSKHWSFDATDADGAQRARAEFVRELRRGAEGDSDFEFAELIFGELVGNVARHAPGRISVALNWSGEEPELHAIDRGPGFALDARAPADPLSESGRGLFIISTLGRRVTTTPIPGRGTHVTVVLPVKKRG